MYLILADNHLPYFTPDTTTSNWKEFWGLYNTEDETTECVEDFINSAKDAVDLGYLSDFHDTEYGIIEIQSINSNGDLVQSDGTIITVDFVCKEFGLTLTPELRNLQCISQ